MIKDNGLRIRCFILALIYSASFMCYSSFKKSKINPKVSSDISNKVVYDISGEIGDELFIGTKSQVIKEYEKNPDLYLAYVIDRRNCKDPVYQIYNSFMINDRETMYKVLNALIEYEKEIPSDWDRTIDSMYIEWCIHNLCYYLDIFPERTKDVDLNNGDESFYNKKILSLIMKNHG